MTCHEERYPFIQSCIPYRALKKNGEKCDRPWLQGHSQRHGRLSICTVFKSENGILNCNIHLSGNEAENCFKVLTFFDQSQCVQFKYKLKRKNVDWPHVDKSWCRRELNSTCHSFVQSHVYIAGVQFEKKKVTVKYIAPGITKKSLGVYWVCRHSWPRILNPMFSIFTNPKNVGAVTPALNYIYLKFRNEKGVGSVMSTLNEPCLIFRNEKGVGTGTLTSNIHKTLWR